MPVQRTRSGLMAKLGAQIAQAHEEHKNDETQFSSFGELPPGIENGIARLVECKFDTYKSGDNEGEYYFYAAGVVLSPLEAEDFNTRGEPIGTRPIEGLRTSIMEPLCETPSRSRKSVSDHLSWIYNELRKLGVDTRTLNPDDLEATAEALKAAEVTFRFRTWRGDPTVDHPNPRTNHVWNGACEWNPGEEGGTPGVADTTERVTAASRTSSTNGSPATRGAAPATRGAAPATRAPATAPNAAPPKAPAAGPRGAAPAAPAAPARTPSRAAPAAPPASQPRAGGGKPGGPKPAPTPAPSPSPTPAGPKPGTRARAAAPAAPPPPPVEELPPPEASFDDQGDLDSLAARADAQEEQAQDLLTQYAVALGITEQEVEQAASWAELAQRIAEAGGPTTESVDEPSNEPEPAEGDAADQGFVPVVEEVHYYTPINKRTGKPEVNSKTKEPLRVECEVLAVDHDNQTVDLKNLDNPKVTYKAVPWDQLGTA